MINTSDTPALSTLIPEPKWQWRRAAVFGGILTSLMLLTFIVYQLRDDAHALLQIAIWLIITNLTLFVIYLVAPTAEYVQSVGHAIREARSLV